MNWLVPKPWSPWMLSNPLPAAAGRTGTASAPVAGSSLNGMRALRSSSEASAVDLASSPACTGTKSGFWLQKNSHSPSAMATASSASRPSWRTAGTRTRSFRLAVALGSAITLMSVPEGGAVGGKFGRDQGAPSDRHVHHVLVGLDEAVAHFDRGPERDLRLLHRHHH